MDGSSIFPFKQDFQPKKGKDFSIDSSRESVTSKAKQVSREQIIGMNKHIKFKIFK